MKIILLTVNSVLLIGLTLYLSICLSGLGRVKELLSAGYMHLSGALDEARIRKLLKSYKLSAYIKLSFFERLDFHFIEKSNIRYYIPFMNFKILCLLSAGVFVAGLKLIFNALRFLPSAAVISFLISLFPFFLLDLLGRYNSEVVRRKLAEFISVLNRWCAVKEDIFYAFEKSAQSGIGEPLDTFLRDAVIQVNRGITPAEVLDMLELKVGNPQFRDFIINIKQNIRHRGDLRKLLTNLENQFYKIEEEYNRRKISTYKDRMTIYCVMFGVLLFGYCFMKSNADVEYYYLGTLNGKLLLTLFSLLYASGVYLSLRITRFKH